MSTRSIAAAVLPPPLVDGAVFLARDAAAGSFSGPSRVGCRPSVWIRADRADFSIRICIGNSLVGEVAHLDRRQLHRSNGNKSLEAQCVSLSPLWLSHSRKLQCSPNRLVRNPLRISFVDDPAMTSLEPTQFGQQHPVEAAALVHVLQELVDFECQHFERGQSGSDDHVLIVGSVDPWTPITAKVKLSAIS